jgi:hypothetical protein
VAAYPDLIAMPAPAHSPAPGRTAQHPNRTRVDTLLLSRINKQTGAHHTDTTPIEQWAHKRRLIAAKARASLV